MKAAETTIPAWQMALKNRPIERNLIFHSDRGVQYACHAFTNLLKKQSLVLQSMSGKGNCWDNAVAESFFKSLKSELVYQQDFQTRATARQAVFEYIEVWRGRPCGIIASEGIRRWVIFPLLTTIVGNF